MNFLKKIKKYSEDSPEEEICGFIVKNKTKIEIKKCKNISIDKKNNFEIPTEEYIQALKSYKIVSIYHSHPNTGEEFSEQDLAISEELIIPILVYSNKTKKFNFFKPEEIRKNKIINDIQKSVSLGVKV